MEVEVGGSRSWAKAMKTIQKITKAKRARGMTQVVEHLLMCKALSLNPSTNHSGKKFGGYLKS
jgi:hypothetical protein